MTKFYSLGVKAILIIMVSKHVDSTGLSLKFIEINQSFGLNLVKIWKKNANWSVLFNFVGKYK